MPVNMQQDWEGNDHVKKIRSNGALFLGLAAIIGVIIAVIIYLYLLAANLGVSLIWNIIPEGLASVADIDTKVYTVALCLIGGLIVGLYQKFGGQYPEDMVAVVKRSVKERYLDYSKIPLIIVASLLPLFFGGAVGPEAGLVGILLGFVFWTLDQYNKQKVTMMDYIEEYPNISRPALFRVMIKTLFLPAANLEGARDAYEWKKPEAVTAGVTTGIVALICYVALNQFVFTALEVPHLEATPMNAFSRVFAIVLIAAGIGAGYLYLLFHKACSFLFRKLREKKSLTVINALLGGLILGLIGAYIPMSMFSGGTHIQAMAYEYAAYTPVMLIVIGLVKLFLTNVCIESGWRGGHIFPIIFSGLSIAYGLSVLLGINQVYAVVLLTTALLATVFQQPVAAIFLSIIFFPLEDIGWMLVAGCIAGCIPQPKALRMNPDNDGFIPNIMRFTKQRRLDTDKVE